MIVIYCGRHGERGVRSYFSLDGASVRVDNVICRYYGFPAESGGNWTPDQAKCHAHGLLEDDGQIEEWDDKLATVMGLQRSSVESVGNTRAD